MRTLIFIAAGLAIVIVALWLARPAKRLAAVGLFALGWLLVVLWNLRTGLSHGYSLQEELPIQALIFCLPVAVGAALAWATRAR